MMNYFYPDILRGLVFGFDNDFAVLVNFTYIFSTGERIYLVF